MKQIIIAYKGIKNNRTKNKSNRTGKKPKHQNNASFNCFIIFTEDEKKLKKQTLEIYSNCWISSNNLAKVVLIYLQKKTSIATMEDFISKFFDWINYVRLKHKTEKLQ